MPEMAPKVDIRAIQWRELQAALGYVTSAEFEYGRGNEEAGAMWLGDVRRVLGALALTLADDAHAAAYALLLENALAEPSVPARKAPHVEP